MEILEALLSLIFLVEKRGVKVKARGCYYTKYTRMDLERIMILSEIKAHKERDVSTIDILGEY